MLPQVSWFQQFCFLCQVADKSLALKTANTTIIINNEIHPQIEPVPTSHSEMLTASWGFPTVGTWKAAVTSLTTCRWWGVRLFALLLSGMDPDGKAAPTDARSDAAVSSRY